MVALQLAQPLDPASERDSPPLPLLKAAKRDNMRRASMLLHRGQAMGTSALLMLRRASKTISQSGQQYSYSGMRNSKPQTRTSKHQTIKRFYLRLPIWSKTEGRKLIWVSLLLLSLLNLGFGPPVLTDGGVPPLRLYPYQVQALGRLEHPPQVAARAALLADARTGAILFEQAAHESLAPASTTKIMTALVALEQGDLSDMVTVPPEALAVGEASMGLVVGEVISLEELLHGLLLVSANDAAATIAIHIGGSVEAFVALMNERAAELGLADTHFVNPHGLDDPEHLASAADLLTLTREALSNSDFVRFTATPQATVAGRSLASTNQLLTSYDGADGVKTGTTDAAGQCLVASATRNEGRAIVVLLGSDDRYADAEALLDFYFEHYAWRMLELPVNRLSSYEDGQGQRWTLRLGEQQAAFLPRWQWPLVQIFRWIDSGAQLASGGVIGIARFTNGRYLLAEVPLRAFASE